MKNIIYTLLIFIFAMACTSNTIYEKPKNLISKNLMADILTDMYIAEGARSVHNKELERSVDYMPLVYEKYQIDSVRFAESNFYYTTKIDDYEAILKVVDNRLKVMKKKYDDLVKKEDSIKLSKATKDKSLLNKLTIEELKRKKMREEQE